MTMVLQKEVNLPDEGKGQGIFSSSYHFWVYSRAKIVDEIDDEEMAGCQLVVGLDRVRKCYVPLVR